MAVGVNIQGRRRAASPGITGKITSVWRKDGLTAAVTVGAFVFLPVLAIKVDIALQPLHLPTTNTSRDAA